MLRSVLIGCVLLGSAMPWTIVKAEDGPCAKVSRDLPRESVLMHDPPQVQTANPGPAVLSFLQPNTLYEVDLLPQRKVTFPAKPERLQPASPATAGLLGIKVRKAGRYRVAIATAHWIDLADGKALVKPLNRILVEGCQRPRAVVEYQLQAEREYRLQLSGATAEQVLVAVTAVEAPKAAK